MSESIQNRCLALATRRHEFLAHAAAMYGRPSAVDLAATDDLRWCGPADGFPEVAGRLGDRRLLDRCTRAAERLAA